MLKDADISEDRQYRYDLSRHWDAEKEAMVFVMLNPSTADADLDDPTIRRCMGFAKREGAGGIIVVNLYAFRATNPKELLTAEDPVGPLNDTYLHGILELYFDRVVVAWGTNAKPDRVRAFRHMAFALGTELYCLGITKNGSPKHPLYLPSDAPLERWI